MYLEEQNLIHVLWFKFPPLSLFINCQDLALLQVMPQKMRFITWTYTCPPVKLFKNWGGNKSVLGSKPGLPGRLPFASLRPLQFEKVITGKKFIAPKDLIKHTNSLLSLENEKKHVSLDQREIGQGNKVSTRCMWKMYDRETHYSILRLKKTL